MSEKTKKADSQSSNITLNDFPFANQSLTDSNLAKKNIMSLSI